MLPITVVQATVAFAAATFPLPYEAVARHLDQLGHWCGTCPPPKKVDTRTGWPYLRKVGPRAFGALHEILAFETDHKHPKFVHRKNRALDFLSSSPDDVCEFAADAKILVADPRFRHEALLLLGKAGSRADALLVMDHLATSSSQALAALERLGGPNEAAFLRAWLDNPPVPVDPFTRERALKVADTLQRRQPAK